MTYEEYDILGRRKPEAIVRPYYSGLSPGMKIVRLNTWVPTWQNTLIRPVKRRLNVDNLNWLCIYEGATGTGKSWSGITTCGEIDANFGIDNVIFSTSQFKKLLQDGELKRGAGVMWDEAGKDIGARSFMETRQKAVLHFLQAFRKYNWAVIFTAPFAYMIDKQLRDLAHTRGYAQYRSRRGWVKWKYYHIFPVPKRPQPIERFPLVMMPDSQIRRVNHFKIGKPRDMNLIKEYEKKKEEFLDAMIEQIPEPKRIVHRNMKIGEIVAYLKSYILTPEGKKLMLSKKKDGGWFIPLTAAAEILAETLGVPSMKARAAILIINKEL